MSTQIKASASLPANPDGNILIAAKGGGIVFAGSLFQYGMRLITAVLLARLLGPEQLGLCNLALSAAFIASGLSSLGLPSAMVRYVPLFASRRDMARLWGTLQIGLGTAAALGLLTTIGLFFLADPIAGQLFHEPRLASLLRVISPVIPFLALTDIIVTAAQGFKRLQYAVIGQDISQPAIRLVLAVALTVVIGLNATRAIVTFNVSVILAWFVLLYFLNKMFSLNRPLSTSQRDVREIFCFTLPVYLSSLIGIFGGNLQTILLGILNTVANVGIFSVASQINIVGQMFHRAVIAATAPIVSELYDRGEREQMRRLYQTATKWTFTLNLPLFLLVVLFPGPILYIFGRSFVDGITALTILAWTNFVNAGTGICEVLVDMTGNTRLKLVNSLVTFSITVGLNFLLIPRFGLIGAAITGLVAVITLNLMRLLEVFMLFRMLPYNLSFLKPVTAGLTALAVTWGLRSSLLPVTHLVYVGLDAALLLGVYPGIVLLLGLSDEDRMVLAGISRRMRTMFAR